MLIVGQSSTARQYQDVFVNNGNYILLSPHSISRDGPVQEAAGLTEDRKDQHVKTWVVLSDREQSQSRLISTI